jgi:hypothetical protein
LSNPAGILNVIFTDWGMKMFYILSLFAPLVFLPFLALEPLIMALPWIGASFISTYPPYYSIYYYYNGFVIPFIFVALLKGIERLGLQQTKKVLAIILLSTAIFGLYLPVAPGSPWNYQLPTTNDRTRLIREILPLIPSNASILTQNDLFSYVSNRVEAYMYMPGSTNISVDYILVDVASQWYKWRQPDSFGERNPPIVYTQEALKDGKYGVLASAKSILLLKKGYTGEPVLFVPYVSKYNYETLTLTTGSIIEDPTSTSRYVLHNGEKDPKGDFWHSPYIDLPPGLYRVTYVIKVNGASEVRQSDQLLTVDVTASSGKILLAKRDVYGVHAPSGGQWFNVSLSFGLRTPTEEIEFKGFAVGNQSVYLDYLMVEQLSPKPVSITESAFNYEDLSLDESTGIISEGIIMHAEGFGTLWRGPYTSLPKGNYTAEFWLKLDRPYIGPLLDIGVSINSEKKVLTRLTVYDYNFRRIDAWQSFDVKFTLLNDSSNVEFPGMTVREGAPISFLLVEVYPDTSG